MTFDTFRNYVEPIFFRVALVVVVLLGCLLAGTGQAVRTRELAVSDCVTHGSSSSAFFRIEAIVFVAASTDSRLALLRSLICLTLLAGSICCAASPMGSLACIGGLIGLITGFLALFTLIVITILLRFTPAIF